MVDAQLTLIEEQAKRKECEERSQRWILTISMIDEQLRFTLSSLDHHRKRNKKIVYVEEIRERIKCLIEQLP